jgi:hypothetical protein
MRAYYGTPRIEGTSEDVFPASPLAIIGVFIEVLRVRFSKENATGLPYYWSNDPTPRPDEEHTEVSPRKIWIESQYLQHPDSRDQLPAILVDRGDTRFDKVALGNRVHHDIPSGKDTYIVHSTTPINILCISKDRGESMNLGDHVSFYLLTLMAPLREAFGFQDVSPPILGATQVYRRSNSDIESWITPINLQVTAKHLWNETPIAPLLRQVAINLKSNQTLVKDVIRDSPRKSPTIYTGDK